jgi:8-oxo-dGTP diphosphatase
VNKHVHVAVGVVVDFHNRVLISRRHPDSHQGDLWEFPGGKVERGETVVVALARELAEELAIRVIRAESMMVIDHDYGDKRVRLDIWRVIEFSGEAYGREGQVTRWVSLSALTDYQFPKANQPILDALIGTV